MSEFIMCSAIWVMDSDLEMVHAPRNIDFGAVYCGYRHCNCLELISHKYDRIHFISLGSVQGFLTSNNRFVDRFEGMEIAKSVEQLLSPETVQLELYSEDLWLSNNIDKEDKNDKQRRIKNIK